MKCPFVIKVCKKCKRILVANEMNFYKKEKNKLRGECKKCTKQCRKKRYNGNSYDKEYRKKNKEKIKEYNKEYKENHKEKIKKKNKEYREKNKEKIKEYNKDYGEKNKEKIKEYQKEYYEEHKEKNKEKIKKYRLKHPEYVFNYNNKRRQLEENQGNGITKEQWIEMMDFFEWRCAYSGEVLGDNRTIDHIIPISKGGEHEVWNCVPMLLKYNKSKHSKDMLEWYIQQDFYSVKNLLKIFDWITYAIIKYKYNKKY